MPKKDTLPTFALLEDSAAATPQARLYEDYVHGITCAEAADWAPAWMRVQECLGSGLHVVALLSYESGAALQGVLEWPHARPSQWLVFRSCRVLDAAASGAFLQELAALESGVYPADAPAGIAACRPSDDAEQCAQAIQAVRDWIAAGDCYQVNYTFRLRGLAYGSLARLYLRLRSRQPVPYAALIGLPDGQALLSCSPELFVRASGGVLHTRPMKGTAAASDDAQENARRARHLAADPKNRAENLMIVDLLRNDLGRVAQPGSVRVSELFQVERFAAVLQMSSSICAHVRPEVGLAELMGALFPCGSITGAPKKRTMEIIRTLESAPRGVYTGAIGWFAPLTAAGVIPDFCLSVPIRTLSLAAPEGRADGARARRFELGVGAGIVYDSQADDEYAECLLKARFLSGLPAEFGLIETFPATRAEGPVGWPEHRARLCRSAAECGLQLDGAALDALLAAHCASLPDGQQMRVRVLLEADGRIHIQSSPCPALLGRQYVLLAESPCPVPADAFWLRHKTTYRQHYDAAWRAAEAAGAFDMLFVNACGALTEGGRSNVFLERGGIWYTPAPEAGLLPGIMRARLIAGAAPCPVVECRLTRQDVYAAERIWLCNAVRGVFEVSLLSPSSAPSSCASPLPNAEPAACSAPPVP